MLRALALAAALPFLSGAAAVPPVDYRLGVEAPAGATPYLAVEMRFRGDADGETTLLLPDDYGSGENSWKYISNLTVDGAQVASGAEEKRVLRHRPNARITVRYVVASAYQKDPAAGGNPYDGPLLRPQWIAAIGDFVFATPADRAKAPATFRWGKIPKGWTFASDLEHGRMGRPMTVGDVVDSITFGGPTATITQHPIPGGTLRVIAPAGPLRDGPLAANTAKVIAAQRAYWNDLNEPYLVAALPLTQPKPTSLSLGGTGRSDAFVVYATPGVESYLLWLLGHEHAHTWMPRLLGEMPAGAEEPRLYWLSEGATDFLAVRTLVRGGLWTPEEGVKRLSEFLAAYDSSSVRTAPNTRIVADFWKNQEVGKLPYQRGLLLALKWDEELRRMSQGRLDFDDVLMSMRDRRRAYPAEKTMLDDALLDAAWGVAKLNLRSDLARYVVAGELVPLPETLFGGCVLVTTKVSPAYDAGFDHEGSFKTKIVQGVRRGGPAWNSGVRNGMALEGWSIRPEDTSFQVTLKVVDRKKKRTITYWPYGDSDRTVRSLVLKPRMTDAETAACGRAIGGL